VDTTPNMPVGGQMTLEDYQPADQYSSRWLVIPDAKATNKFGGIPARVDTEDHDRAMQVVGGYPVVCMIGEGPSLAFFRLEEVEQALLDGYAL
jgi:hypothetical protein